jgi:hypothetical protein
MTARPSKTTKVSKLRNDDLLIDLEDPWTFKNFDFEELVEAHRGWMENCIHTTYGRGRHSKIIRGVTISIDRFRPTKAEYGGSNSITVDIVYTFGTFVVCCCFTYIETDIGDRWNREFHGVAADHPVELAEWFAQEAKSFSLWHDDPDDVERN